jgi:Domain of unknown function (DUF4198)
MPRRVMLVVVLLLAVTTSLLAHDMFLKLETYFLEPHRSIIVPLLNGTFSSSENAIDRPRIEDIAVVGPSGRRTYDTTVVSARHDTTFLALETGEPGTYVLGLSTRPNIIAMTGEQFGEYLAEEGLHRVIADRARAGTSATPARERYAKHVKAIVQVGQRRTSAFQAELGYTAELVPLDNPYAWKRGQPIRFRGMVNGRPTPGLTIVAGGRTPRGARLPRRELTTDADGIATLRPTGPGHWYATFIHIGPVTAPDHDYESEWATITFQLR